jgi:hypothetical protein
MPGEIAYSLKAEKDRPRPRGIDRAYIAEQSFPGLGPDHHAHSGANLRGGNVSFAKGVDNQRIDPKGS